ncbi:unnamed protein product [Ascophyllum nodosum]
MYERGVLGKKDVALTQAWLQDLVSAGYVFELPKVLLVGAMGGGGNVRHDGEAAAAAPRPQGNTDYSSGQQGLFSSHAKEALDSAEEETRQEEAAAVEGGSATGADAGTPDLVEKNKKQEAMPSQEGVIPQMPNARSTPKVQVLLVIAVVSARPERRTAIRDSWLAWRDDRVVLRFFTEQLDDTFGQPENQTAEAKALVEESSAHGDVVVLDIDHGMNFGLKLVSAMRYALDRYDFDFFLRLDDSYFLCLRRLLDELSALMRGVTANDAPHAPSQRMLYAGHRYCERNATRIDEAYMLVSGALVRRVMSTPGLRCSSQEGTSAGRWFTVGHGVNRAGDVRWVHDPRLDHDGDWWRPPRAGGAARSDYASVCEKHIGVHRAFPERMAGLWAVVSQQKTTKSGEDLAGSSSAVAFEYVQDVKCEHTPQGMSPARHARDKAQPCEVFHG